jgi:DnaK suppressor protein
MRNLTIEQRESLAAWLRGRAELLREEIGTALRQSGSPEAVGLANHLEEIDDDAVADLEASLDIAALERDVLEMRNIENALERLHTPEYGICTDCAAEIPFLRLQANPLATRCVPCQSRSEHAHQAAPHTL